ncbi:hypothetical protein B484DRAFT_457028 [Ochromonadaceae sp. CCMP2298]|nr:hypothetical protein B484DRAFT_457028 [Ochromonadaceae sp. CCMP2298]
MLLQQSKQISSRSYAFVGHCHYEDMKLDLILDIGDCVRGFLGASCDAQLRLVSKGCKQVMQKWARGKFDIKDYLSSAAVFTWALKELGMPVGEDICEEAARGGHLALLQNFQTRYHNQYMQVTTLWNFLASLFITRQWTDIKIRWDAKTCSNAAYGGHLPVLRWLRAQDPPSPWGEEACTYATEGGHLHVLQWMRAQDPPCPWDQETCQWAAEGGHLHVLQWMRAQDPPCPWDQQTCRYAAMSGHVHVLQWLRAQDPPCPWDQGTCWHAAAGGHLHVLRWLRAQDPPCPWDEVTASQWGPLL